jgi:hypothetical protein
LAVKARGVGMSMMGKRQRVIDDDWGPSRTNRTVRLVARKE